MNNNQITISKATAERAMFRLGEWLEWIDELDSETRADVLALDELIKALDAEAQYQAQIDERRENARKANEEYQARIKAEAGE
jgi:hypothetical protein